MTTLISAQTSMPSSYVTTSPRRSVSEPFVSASITVTKLVTPTTLDVILASLRAQPSQQNYESLRAWVLRLALGKTQLTDSDENALTQIEDEELRECARRAIELALAEAETRLALAWSNEEMVSSSQGDAETASGDLAALRHELDSLHVSLQLELEELEGLSIRDET